MQNNNRIYAIDYMRGFAMVMVILAHAMQRSMEGTVNYSDTITWKLIYDWHMPLFFIVSGYLVEWVLFFCIVVISTYICHINNIASGLLPNAIASWCNSINCTSLVFLVMYLLNKTRRFQVIKTALAFMGKYSLEYYVLQFLILNCGFWIGNIYVKWLFNFISCTLICTLVIILVKKFPVIDGVLWGNFRFLKHEGKSVKND